jgi:hypothetical protein
MKKVFGYARSTDAEEAAIQLYRLFKFPCTKQFIFLDSNEDQGEPGPELKILMSKIEPSDTIVVDKLSTFGLEEKGLNGLNTFLANLKYNNIEVVVLDSMN